MKKIASVGPDIPQELLQASGRYSGPLGWNIDRAFPLAQQWLESKFPLWAFSVVEDWAAGKFDHLETIVFSRSDDSAQRLYYYVCELRARGLLAGPEPVLFDVARIARASSEARSLTATRALAARFEVGDEAIEAAIAHRYRLQPPPQTAASAPVCLLAGTPPPDHRLHSVIDLNGWAAVGRTLAQIWTGQTKAETGTGDPCAALARRLHADSKGTRGFYDRGAEILRAARDSQAKAVVLWYAEEDEAEIWHLPAQRAALEAAGLPVLTLTRRDWRASDGAADEIVAFLAGASA